MAGYPMGPVCLYNRPVALLTAFLIARQARTTLLRLEVEEEVDFTEILHKNVRIKNMLKNILFSECIPKRMTFFNFLEL